MFDNNIINNPMIPFETPTPGGFAPNAEVIIHGRSEKGKHGFVIEFGAGNDVALHMSFRYKSEEKLVMNTAINGDWQKEERHKNPVFHEHSFEIKVQCKPTEFIVSFLYIVAFMFLLKIFLDLAKASQIRIWTSYGSYVN